MNVAASLAAHGGNHSGIIIVNDSDGVRGVSQSSFKLGEQRCSICTNLISLRAWWLPAASAKRLSSCNMTQSGVSQHIRALEDALGTELFARGRRGVELTPAGQRLLSYCEGIFRLVAEAELAVTDVAGLRAGQLTIGVTPASAPICCPNGCRCLVSVIPTSP